MALRRLMRKIRTESTGVRSDSRTVRRSLNVPDLRSDSGMELESETRRILRNLRRFGRRE